MSNKIVQAEHEILAFWEENKVFEKSITSKDKSKVYNFYDGPPFATGLPHYGNLVAGLMKDVVPRYFTMKGFRVERKWGWDCHGLPVENIIEKELDLKSKKDIEEFGVGKFNEACRATVLRYADEWKKIIRRTGRFVDMENDYKTMDLEFMESVWWVFKELWDKNLIYEGKKPMHICPRCVTPLSNFEVTQGYKDVKDISVIAKFNLTEKIDDKTVHVLAWTTTPWTLPGNVLLAINKEINYVLVEKEEEYFIIAKDLSSKILEGKIIRDIKTNELLNKQYEPIFPYFKDTENAFKIVDAKFVTTEDGTGVVHIAPAFGEDDYNIGLREKTGFVQHVNMDGTFIDEVTHFKGLEVKPKDNPLSTDIEILKYLQEEKKLFSKEKYAHSYPHCWRCNAPLLNYATSSWFVNVTKIKDNLIQNNQEINWVPNHIKEGRFGKWLEGARDWAISRNRFWGTPLPIYKAEDGEYLCLGSVKELEELSGKKITDLHKHVIDDITITKNGKTYKRIDEVLDCWFESGAMPYAQSHYPFENKELLESCFPAEFIAEGQDQTRGWFYTLHVLATALTLEKSSLPVTNRPAFKNVIVNGIVLADDGKKMSKSLQNYPDPNLLLEKYGADALRYYLASSPVMAAKNLNFNEEGVREVYSKLINTLDNVLSFYNMFKTQPKKTTNLLDKWIISKLSNLNKEMVSNLDNYQLAEAARPVLEFVLDLSQWHIRRSRDRFKEDNDDAKMATYTIAFVLENLSKLIAPFTPFIAERMYLDVTNKNESVHLQDYPNLNEVNQKLEEDMVLVREAVSLILDQREKVKMPIRQALNKATIYGINIPNELTYLILDETNIKSLEFKEGDKQVELDITLTPNLIKEGMIRDLIRKINQERKNLGLTIDNKIKLELKSDDKLLNEALKEFEDEILSSVQAISISVGGEKMMKIKDLDVEFSIIFV
jgi:isoleucyl-tRNA synthetase